MDMDSIHVVEKCDDCGRIPTSRLDCVDICDTRFENDTHVATLSMRSHGHLIQNKPNSAPLSHPLINLVNHSQRFLMHTSQDDPTIFKASSTFHILHCIFLDLIIRRLLLQYIDQLSVLRIRADAVNKWEGEFAFCQVFAKSFVLGVLGGGEIHVVVANLEEEADEVNQGHKISGIFMSQGPNKLWNGISTDFSLELSACINLTANLNRPPVLFPTISR